jgi:hypothetical protein
MKYQRHCRNCISRFPMLATLILSSLKICWMPLSQRFKMTTSSSSTSPDTVSITTVKTTWSRWLSAARGRRRGACQLHPGDHTSTSARAKKRPGYLLLLLDACRKPTQFDQFQKVFDDSTSGATGPGTQSPGYQVAGSAESQGAKG